MKSGFILGQVLFVHGEILMDCWKWALESINYYNYILAFWNALPIAETGDNIYRVSIAQSLSFVGLNGYI